MSCCGELCSRAVLAVVMALVLLRLLGLCGLLRSGLRGLRGLRGLWCIRETLNFTQIKTDDGKTVLGKLRLKLRGAHSISGEEEKVSAWFRSSVKGVRR